MKKKHFGKKKYEVMISFFYTGLSPSSKIKIIHEIKKIMRNHYSKKYLRIENRDTRNKGLIALFF
jgi:hypothetical protein